MSTYLDLRNLKGWYIGKFEPSLIESEKIEVGIKHVAKGTMPDGHFHKIKKEYTIIIRGSIRVNDKIYNQNGDCLVLNPYEKNDQEFLEDTLILVINTPSARDDKY